jgi:hypothetical protein
MARMKWNCFIGCAVLAAFGVPNLELLRAQTGSDASGTASSEASSSGVSSSGASSTWGMKPARTSASSGRSSSWEAGKTSFTAGKFVVGTQHGGSAPAQRSMSPAHDDLFGTGAHGLSSEVPGASPASARRASSASRGKIPGAQAASQRGRKTSSSRSATTRSSSAKSKSAGSRKQIVKGSSSESGSGIRDVIKKANQSK